VPHCKTPVGHTQLEPEQWVPDEQTLVQLPQWLLSLVRSTHADPQALRLPGQPHVLDVQTPPVGQAIPHPPQWAGSLVRSRQPVTPGQAENPMLHEAPHVLAEQVAVACATVVVHAFVQLPQWPTLVVVSTQALPHRVGVAAGQPETHA
jgi:hypothetical protein